MNFVSEKKHTIVKVETIKVKKHFLHTFLNTFLNFNDLMNPLAYCSKQQSL